MATSVSDRKTEQPLQLLQGILPFDMAQLPSEIVAGLTLAALAIPEVMGYTKISGTPVITGLYTILIPAALFAIFGSSRHLVVGADSATAAILAAGLAGLAVTGTDHYLALAGVLALLSAIFLILARIVGLGFMADFLSRSVLIGFLTGVGVQVALGELPSLFGLPHEGHGTFDKLRTAAQHLAEVNIWSLAIAVSVLAIVLGSRRISKRIPGALIAIVAAISVSMMVDLGRHTAVLGAVPSGLPHFSIPQIGWDWKLFQELLPTAFAMFVVILAQSAATSRAYAARYNERFSENTDLVGLALANIGAGLTGTFVVNGSPTKTQMVDSAGGRTQVSLLAMAVVVGIVLLFLTKPLTYLPEAVLSAVVFLIGVELIDVDGMRRIFDERRSEFFVALFTAAMVVFIGVEDGILLAMALSLIEHTRHGYRPKDAVLARASSGGWKAEPVESKAQAVPGLIVYRFTHSLYFANVQVFTDEITELAGSGVRWICVDASAIDDVDFTAAEAIKRLVPLLEARGVRLVVAQLSDAVKAQSGSGLAKVIGPEFFFATVNDAIAAFSQSAKP